MLVNKLDNGFKYDEIKTLEEVRNVIIDVFETRIDFEKNYSITHFFLVGISCRFVIFQKSFLLH